MQPDGLAILAFLFNVSNQGVSFDEYTLNNVSLDVI